MTDFTAPYPSKPSWYLLLRVTEGTLDAANNRSWVDWILYLVRGNGDTPNNNSGSSYSVTGPGGFSGTFPGYRFGSTGTGTNYSATPVGNGVLIASGGDWVTHNPNGTGSVNVAASHASAATLGTAVIPTSVFTLTTLTQLPGTPTSVALAYTSDTQATLSWVQNAPSNGQPTSNQIQTSVNGAAFSQVASIAPATSLVIGCAANQKIIARVRATNGAGSSAYSASSAPVYTTPAAPTAVSATKDAALDITIAWTPNVAFTEHQHVVEHGTVTGGVTTWDGSPLATVAAGTSSYKHVAPNPAQVHVYRVRARNTDVAARQSATVLSNQVQLLAAPAKPTMPALPAYADKAKNLVVNWVHNPVDTTPQSAYEFGFSTNGGSSWSSTGKVTSATAARTINANTYAANVALTVRVRTWGQATSGGSDGTGASPWSDPQTLTFKTRPVATIIAPADGGTWPESNLIVQLGFSQAEGATFVRATIVLSDGVDDLETLDSTTLASTALATDVENGGTYTLTVTIVDSNGIVSDPVESEFDVAFTLPVAALLEALTYLTLAGVAQLDLSIPTPGGGEEAAVAVTVTRTIDGVVETLVDQYPITGPTLTILDTTPTIVGTNEYRIRTFSEDGATADSLAALISGEELWAFLSTGDGFERIISFYGDLKVASAPARATALVEAAGRARPIALFGEAGSLVVTGSATIDPEDGSTVKEIEEFILNAGIVCYRDNTGRRIFGTLTASIDSPSSLVSTLTFKVVETSR